MKCRLMMIDDDGDGDDEQQTPYVQFNIKNLCLTVFEWKFHLQK